MSESTQKISVDPAALDGEFAPQSVDYSGEIRDLTLRLPYLQTEGGFHATTPSLEPPAQQPGKVPPFITMMKSVQVIGWADSPRFEYDTYRVPNFVVGATDDGRALLVVEPRIKPYELDTVWTAGSNVKDYRPEALPDPKEEPTIRVISTERHITETVGQKLKKRIARRLGRQAVESQVEAAPVAVREDGTWDIPTHYWGGAILENVQEITPEMAEKYHVAETMAALARAYGLEGAVAEGAAAVAG